MFRDFTPMGSAAALHLYALTVNRNEEEDSSLGPPRARCKAVIWAVQSSIALAPPFALLLYFVPILHAHTPTHSRVTLT